MLIPSPVDMLGIFGLNSPEFARVREITASQVPEPYQSLLVHGRHMTVSMESHHGVPVDVDVLQVRHDGTTYAREILLRRQSDHAVVQFGIARLALQYIPRHVQDQVLARETPLGRILINNNVFRDVQLGSLWEFELGGDFQSVCETRRTSTYGRTALIHLNGTPAIELLEVAILDSPPS